MVTLGNEWDNILGNEFKKDYYLSLREFLKKEFSLYTVYPHMSDIFNAFKSTSYDDVKVVILGQDPYHNPKQAHGLAFSVMEGTPIPPSLMNIYKEINSDTGAEIPKSGELYPWATQGVLLLNTVLTVRQGMAFSHRNKGWEIFTDNVISYLNNREKPIVFLLWGKPAQQKKTLITNKNHCVLTAPHPSPLSAYGGFFGCKHFSRTNEFLDSNGMQLINWKI